MKTKILCRYGIHPDARNELMKLIEEYVACRIDESWKGDGDPADIPLIDAKCAVAELKLQRMLDKLVLPQI